MIKKGIRKMNYVMPKMEGYGFIWFGTAARELSKVMVAGAKIKEIEGDFEGAYEDYLDTIRFGNDLARGGLLIHGLTSIAIESLTLSTMRAGLKDSDGRTLEMVIDSMKEAEDNFLPLSEILKREFAYLRGSLVNDAITGRGNSRNYIAFGSAIL